MISSKRIHDILTDCLFEDASKVTDTTEFVMGEAVMRTFCFVPEKVEYKLEYLLDQIIKGYINNIIKKNNIKNITTVFIKILSFFFFYSFILIGKIIYV